MRKVLLLGAGKIGSLIATLLAGTEDYFVHIGDIDPEPLKQLDAELSPSHAKTAAFDVLDKAATERYLAKNELDAVISSLPYYCNPTVAELARTHKLHYFDLTEDVEVTHRIHAIASGSDHA